MANLQVLYCIIEWRDWNVRGKRILLYMVEERINAMSLVWTILSMAFLQSTSTYSGKIRIWLFTSQFVTIERGLADWIRFLGRRLGRGLITPLETDEVIPARNQTANVDNRSYSVRIQLNIEHGGGLMMLTRTLFLVILQTLKIASPRKEPALTHSQADTCTRNRRKFAKYVEIY